jgi:Domain of unknown function (DUF5666)
MDAISYDRPEEQWDSFEDEPELALPGRPRRQVFNRWSASLLALILGVVGFYVGVRVEKGQLAGSSSNSALSAGTAGPTGRASTTGAAGTAVSGRGAGGAGLRGLFGGGGAGGSASFGTVSSINGNSLYVTQPTGNTIKVTLSSATKVTKSVAVGKNAVRPGDAVVVQGAKSANGGVSATSVSDTGASPAAAASGASSTGSSGSSAVNSLFGGG